MTETEKITINVGAVDLGKIDLLVEQGHYSNRTDFIRSAIRSQLEKHTIEVQQAVTRHSFGIGVFQQTLADFERYKAKGEKIKIDAIGVYNIPSNVPVALVEACRGAAPEVLPPKPLEPEQAALVPPVWPGPSATR